MFVPYLMIFASNNTGYVMMKPKIYLHRITTYTLDIRYPYSTVLKLILRSSRCTKSQSVERKPFFLLTMTKYGFLLSFLQDIISSSMDMIQLYHIPSSSIIINPGMYLLYTFYDGGNHCSTRLLLVHSNNNLSTLTKLYAL